MRDTLRLFVVVGEATLIVTAGWFALALTLILLGFKPELIPAKGEILVATALFLLIGPAAWWMFRKLRAHFTRREARSVAIAFGVFTPVSLLMAILLGEIFGGYTGVLLGDRFSFLGALVGIIVFTALLSFVFSALVLWFTRRIVKTEQL